MSFIGIFTVFYYKVFTKLNNKALVIIGLILYAIGIFLGVLPDNLVIVSLSAATAALEANLVILGSRFWVLYFTKTNVQAKVIKVSEASSSTVKYTALFILGFLIFIDNRLILATVALLPLLAILVIPNINDNVNSNASNAVNRSNNNIKNHAPNHTYEGVISVSHK